MPYRLKMRHVLAGLVVISVLFAYQNCAPTNDSGTSTLSSYASTLPFAYRAQIDTMAYMSCSNITAGVNPRAYFSYRASAYSNRTGGIMLSSPFITATSHYTTANRALALSSSDLNAGALLNLSIRSRSNAQSVWQTTGVRSGYEIDTFLPELDGPDVAGVLAATGAPSASSFMNFVNYFPGTATRRLMEASLRYFQYENVASQTRGNLEGVGNPAYLVVGYSGSPDPSDTTLRMPPPAVAGTVVTADKAYGVGYQFAFSLPTGYSSGERRVISSYNGLQEVDLSTGQTQASSWDCGAGGNYQFEIIRPEDIVSGYVTGCYLGPDTYANSQQQQALAAVRRVLRVEDWYVDVAHHCVVPKGTGDVCYGQLQGTQKILYGPPSCPLVSSNDPNYTCPHFVSVCIRQ